MTDQTDPLDALYRERAHLVAYLAATADDAVLVQHAVDAPDWAIIFITAGGWQMSWHIAHRDLDLFKNVPRVEADDPRAQWDGHTTSHKYARLHGHTHGIATTPRPRDFDSDPAALAWARAKIQRHIDQAEEFRQRANAPTTAKTWRVIRNFLRSRLVGGDGCVIADFDERLPEWKAAIRASEEAGPQ